MKLAHKFALLFFLTLCFASAAIASEVGRFTVVEGRVDVLAPGQKRAVAVKIGDAVSEGDIIRTKSDSFAEVVFTDSTRLRIAESSRAEVKLYDVQNGKRNTGSINLFRGKVRATVPKTFGSILPAAFRPKPSFEITTETAAAGVRGTDFIVSHTMGTTAVLVLSGLVETRNLNFPDRIIPVSAGFRTIVHQNEPPLAVQSIGRSTAAVLERSLDSHEKRHHDEGRRTETESREKHRTDDRMADAPRVEHASYERQEISTDSRQETHTETEHNVTASPEIMADAPDVSQFTPEIEDIAENIIDRPVSETNTTVLSQITSTDFDTPGSMELTWTAAVNLDAYLYVPQSGGHTAVTASNPGAAGSPLYAVLARDITTGGGAEIIDVSELRDGTYYYSVHNASGSNVSGTGAQVKIISEGSVIQIHNVPATGTGQWWNVVRIEDGHVVTVNSVGTQAPVNP